MLRYNKKTLKNYSKYFIYKITNPNGAVYIGATTNIELRIKIYAGDIRVFKNQSNLCKSILKYSWENHTIEVIKSYEGDFNITDLNDIEQSYIMLQYSKEPNKTMNTIVKGLSKEQMNIERDI